MTASKPVAQWILKVHVYASHGVKNLPINNIICLFFVLLGRKARKMANVCHFICSCERSIKYEMLKS